MRWRGHSSKRAWALAQDEKRCACGCGELAGRYSSDCRGHVIGGPRKFVNGHNRRGAHQSSVMKQGLREARIGKKFNTGHKGRLSVSAKIRCARQRIVLDLRREEEINRRLTMPENICACGCGETAGRYEGYVRKGEPRKFIHGHHVRHLRSAKEWMRLGNGIHKMTRIEKKMESLLDPAQWRYVGLGDVVIGTSVPDFISIKGERAVIEVNGCFWHACSECYPDMSVVLKNSSDKFRKRMLNCGARDAKKVRNYRALGFKCYVVWEHELKANPEKVLARINGRKLYVIHKTG